MLPKYHPLHFYAKGFNFFALPTKQVTVSAWSSALVPLRGECVKQILPTTALGQPQALQLGKMISKLLGSFHLLLQGFGLQEVTE